MPPSHPADSPICSPSLRKVYRASVGQAVHIVCQVDSNSSDDVIFSWNFNSSHHFLPLSTFTTKGTTSTLTYIPKHTKDYGDIMCQAKNSVGSQKDPCRFSIIPGGKNTLFILFKIGFCENLSRICCSNKSRQVSCSTLLFYRAEELALHKSLSLSYISF